MTENDTPSSWSPLDLGEYLDGTYIPQEPTILRRCDGAAMFYPGKLHTVIGESESLKTWLLLVAAVTELDAGNVVTYVDFEDSPESVTGRLALLGAPADAIKARFRYVHPEEALFTRKSGGTPLLQAEAMISYLEACDGASLVVLDGLNEGMALHGLNILDTPDVATFYNYVGRSVTRAGPAVSFIDHTPHRSSEMTGKTGRAIGSQHKISGLDVAYNVTVKRPFGVGLTGTAAITVVKDRPGQVRRYCAGDQHRDFAELTLSSSPAGTEVRWLLTAQSEGGFRPTMYMERVSHTLEAAVKPMSLRAVRENTSGRGTHIDTAVEVLLAEGYVERVTGGFRSVRDYREVNDVKRVPNPGTHPLEVDDDDD